MKRLNYFIIDQLRQGQAAYAYSLLRNIQVCGLRHYALTEADYYPNVTPVGHATLSTGERPVSHQIHGREWATRDASGAWAPMSIGTTMASSASRPRNNLAAKLRDGGYLTFVASAKDFVSFLLGGADADICVYPVFPTKPSMKNIGWSVHLEFSQRILAKGPGVIAVVNNARVFLQDMLVDLGVPAGSVVSQPNHISNSHYTIDFGFKGAYLRNWPDLHHVDRFYSRVAECAWQELLRTDNSAIIQSLFACDMIGHFLGGSDPEYRRTLQLLLSYVANTTSGCYDPGDEVAYVVTSDHGGRDVLHRIDLDSSAGEPAIPPTQLACMTLNDCVYLYCNSPVRTHADRVALAYGQGMHPVTFYGPDQALLGNSFPAQSVPDLVLAPAADAWLSLDPLTPHQLKGSHGLSLCRGAWRNEDDFRVPLLAGRSSPFHPMSKEASDEGRRFESGFPAAHADIRDWVMNTLLRW